MAHLSLLEIYDRLYKGDITPEKASRMLNTQPRMVKHRLNRWGDRLPTLLFLLEKMGQGAVRPREVAEELGTSVRNVYLLARHWQVAVPPAFDGHAVAEIQERRSRSRLKWLARKKYAVEVIAAQATLEDAAEAAEVSPRQMRRWCDRLLEQHFGLHLPDLRDLSTVKREKMAAQIEKNEGMTLGEMEKLRKRRK